MPSFSGSSGGFSSASNFTAGGGVVLRELQSIADAGRKGAGSVDQVTKSLAYYTKENIKLRREVDKTTAATTRMNHSFSLFGINLKTIIGITAASYLLNVTNKLGALDNQLRVVTDSETNLADVRSRLYEISNKTFQGFESQAIIYARMSRAARELGFSQEELLTATENLAKATLVSGALPQESRAALIQLAQGIASDRFGGEEYRAVAEQLPYALTIIQRNLGVTRGELRELSKEGKLTAKVIVEALVKGLDELDDSFQRVTPTISHGWDVFANGVELAIKRIGEISGITEYFAEGFHNLGTKITQAINPKPLSLIIQQIKDIKKEIGEGPARGAQGLLFGSELHTDLRALEVERREAIIRMRANARAQTYRRKVDPPPPVHEGLGIPVTTGVDNFNLGLRLRSQRLTEEIKQRLEDEGHGIDVTTGVDNFDKNLQRVDAARLRGELLSKQIENEKDLISGLERELALTNQLLSVEEDDREITRERFQLEQQIADLDLSGKQADAARRLFEENRKLIEQEQKRVEFLRSLNLSGFEEAAFENLITGASLKMEDFKNLTKDAFQHIKNEGVNSFSDLGDAVESFTRNLVRNIAFAISEMYALRAVSQLVGEDLTGGYGNKSEGLLSGFVGSLFGGATGYNAAGSGFSSGTGYHYAEGFASGGYVKGRTGVDNVPAYLTHGEMVMNRSATNKNYGALEAMNAGASIGGTVVNITNNSSNTQIQQTDGGVDDAGRAIVDVVISDIRKGGRIAQTIGRV